MNLAHLLQRMARMDPQRPAIYSGSRMVATYGQWAARSASVARRLQGAGLQPGDRVALFMHNHPRYLEVMFGAWWAGLAVVPINAKLHLREAQWIVDNAQARWVFVTSDVVLCDAAAFAGVDSVMAVDSPACDVWLQDSDGDEAPIVDRAPDDLAWLFYTSGTTGRPKGVMLTHRNLMTMGLGYFSDVDPIASQDVIAYAAPMSHGAGIYAIPHLMAGACHAVPASGGFDLPNCSHWAAT
jgi:long-chain acyl-CoA synthetase